MQSFENRMRQLETKPNNRILENSVQPQEDEGKSPKAFPMAWITAPSQVNPDSEKIFNFSTNISDQKFGVTLDSAPRFVSLRSANTTNQVLFLMGGHHALSQLHPDRNKILGFSVSKNLHRASGAITSAAKTALSLVPLQI